MKNLLTRPLFQAALLATAAGGVVALSSQHNTLEASSHREAPLIADDPLADNTDLYAFRSPDSPNNDGNASVTIIANYIPLELPQGGPNYNTFGENVRYEIHVKNNPATAGDDITYRFTFTRTNQDPTTFFNIRLGQQNLKTTYTCEKSVGGGAFTTIVTNGVVPPPNIGPRSINGAAGLNQAASYSALMTNAIQTLSDGTKIFCGATDDPFFADLGGIFDLGGIRAPGAARDGLARKNTHAIALQIPVTVLAKAGTPALGATTNILDSNYIIGVWASASRPSTRVLSATGAAPTTSGNYVQVSRIGMPLLNEVINPIGAKDAWNSGTPYAEVAATDDYLSNPELGLYMADNTPVPPAAPKPAGQTYYGEAVQGLGPLRVQSKSLAGQALGGLGGASFAGFDFRNGAAGLSGLAGNAALNGTALAANTYGPYLLRAGKPRSVDILPIFHTGVPNLAPYQLATGKNGNPLAAGKPFINNFLLVGGSASNPGGDMLRLNMAVPPTPRNSANFSSEGLLAAAVLGLTNATYNTTTTVQNIPNMDGFPNGRRLEDDVTRIELQAVGGAVLAAIGLWYDDYTTTSTSPVTTQLGNVLNFNAGITANDTTFKASFPYSQTPWSGTTAQRTALAQRSAGLGLSPNLTVANAYPNPFADRTTLRFELPTKGTMSVIISDVTGRKVATIAKDKAFGAGANELAWTPGRDVAPGQYIATLYNGSTVVQSVRIERH
ncbi:DUF4331 family protein [Microvirga sp. STS02]|uniref:DUF4331 family protein n=1 Tax=Hymenobacter negativus TaxID=2795026 RepID=UPI0018DDF4D3|nr:MULTISPECIES: DUF4331 family protein [Bacteria]MBH8568412.1 DUF4331 family protein [Hymenobacter negativus]MBR7208147.1 DUF4331 family protein [Microvirga sp. STS02]